MDGQRLGKILGELSFASQLSESALAQMGAIASLERFSAGSVLFREGAQNPNFYLIREGRVALDVNVPGRGPVRILTLGPGDMVAWSAMIGSGEMTTSAVALEDIELVVCQGQELLSLSESNHEFGYQLMHRVAVALSNRLTATRLQLLDLFRDPLDAQTENMEESREHP